MTSCTEKYQRTAAECEHESAIAPAPALKSKYLGIAQQWRAMAEQKKGVEGKNDEELAHGGTAAHSVHF